MGINMGQGADVLQTKHRVLCCCPCQVDPVLKKLQDRYRGPEPSDMVEMFEGEQFFAAFERGISIDMGMAVLGSFCSYLLLVLLWPWTCFWCGMNSSMAFLSVSSSPTTHSSQPLDIELATFSGHTGFLSTFHYQSAVCRLSFLLMPL